MLDAILYAKEIDDSHAYCNWITDIVERSETEEIKDSEIWELTEMEYHIGKKYVEDHEELWLIDDYFVITFSWHGGPIISGFELLNDAQEYSMKMQNDYYTRGSNPYFMGHVFFRKGINTNIHDLILS